MDMLSSLTVVIISQCLHISKPHIIHLKYIVFLVNHTLIKLKNFLKKYKCSKHSFQKIKQNSEKPTFIDSSFFPVFTAFLSFTAKGFYIRTPEFAFSLNKDTEMFSAKPSGCFSVFILLRLSLVFEECFNHSLFWNSPFLCTLLAVCLNLCLLCGFFTLSPSLKWQCFSGFCPQPALFSFLIPEVLTRGHASESP